jgi:hypothetical protein
MAKRVYVAIPAGITAEIESLAKELGSNPNQFGVNCIEGCMAAIKADKLIGVPVVQHARRILRKDNAAADRLLVDLLEKTFPELPKNTEHFRQILIEETNKIDGQLTQERLKAAHSVAMARWKGEGKI